LFHVHALLKHVLTAEFTSLTLAYTVTLVASNSVLEYVAVVEYAWTTVHPQLHIENSYCNVHHHVSLHAAVYVKLAFSFTGQLFVNVLIVGVTLFHVAVAVAHQLNHCASIALYEYVIAVASTCAGAVYVLAVCHQIVVVQVIVLYHWYVNVLHPGSLTSAVYPIGVDTAALLLNATAVGATLSHVAVLDGQFVDTHPLPSVTFTYTVYVHGSSDDFIYVLLVSHTIVVVHAALLYHW
jgi:hypothetical protein